MWAITKEKKHTLKTVLLRANAFVLRRPCQFIVPYKSPAFLLKSSSQHAFQPLPSTRQVMRHHHQRIYFVHFQDA